nr:reverse transcriptase domain-containing protein [Tanacetum cinerariifolium]
MISEGCASGPKTIVDPSGIIMLLQRKLDELEVGDSVHESEDSHAFRGSFNMPTLSFNSLHEIFPFLRGEVATSNQARKKALPYRSERRHDKFTLLIKSPKEILALDKGKLKAPPPMTTPVKKRNINKFCEFHEEVGHNTDECMHLKRQIEELIKNRKFPHVIKELKQGSGKDQPKTTKKGETSRKDMPMEILMVQPLKNAGATYQRLFNKAFQKQIGRNLEVYMDDLVIKSRTEPEIIRDIKETFKILREINMKLNPKKCTFGIEDGTFLGYKVNTVGIMVCPDKVGAVLNLPSLKCLKDVQKLNGKLASLNRFLSKSAKKSLPFFKTLKKCTKKSDFQWTAKAEAAFKEMKKLIAELPTLTAPMEKEELIVYLAAVREAISAVLMTEREAKQMLVYFVSRLLSLVHASKRLKRYIQAHIIIVIRDQPIKQILSRLEVTGRLQKLSIELGEYGIQYRPKTSVNGQILADFIVKRLEDDPQGTPMEELSDPWTLFTDGSSCIDGSGAGLILTNPEGAEFTYALRFDATNNKAEYEALIAGLRIAEQMGVKSIQANVDSRLVVNWVKGSYIAKEPDMIQYLEKVKTLSSSFKNSSFKKISIKQVPRSENKKATALRKIASTRFTHLTKQVLVEELKEKSINEAEVLAVVEEEGDALMTPIYN